MLEARWPVPEILTDRAGQFVDDLQAELRTAGSPDPARDVLDIERALFDGRADGETDVEGAGAPSGRAAAAARHPVRGLAGRILVGAYPLLRMPLAAGWVPRRLPVAAERALTADDPRTAARRTLGPRVTRPLVRALAASLVPVDGTVAWDPLVLALMAAPHCGPEQLTEILTATPWRPNAVVFSVGEVDRARAMLAERAPRRVAESLRAALEQPNGTVDLLQEITAFDARPPAPPPGAAVAAIADDPPRPRHVAPRRAAPFEQPIAHPRTLRQLVGRSVGTLRVCLPETPDELLVWGVAMDNCLGIYRAPVAAGDTHIIGFQRGTALEYAAEVSRTGVLRQLEAPGNREPDDATGDRIVAFLREHRVVIADARRPAC